MRAMSDVGRVREEARTLLWMIDLKRKKGREVDAKISML
jgi:hypothetical protein